MAETRQIVVTTDGPVLISGPVEVVLPDGVASARTARSPRSACAAAASGHPSATPATDAIRCARTTPPTSEEGRAQQHRTATG